MEVARKNQQDYDMERYSIAVKHIIKYLLTTDVTYLDTQTEQLVNVERSKWVRTIVREANQIILGESFKVYKDLSIEAPFSFADDEFDRFLVEVGKRGIYPY